MSAWKELLPWHAVYVLITLTCCACSCTYVCICRCCCTITDIFRLLCCISDFIGLLELSPQCAIEGRGSCTALWSHFLQHAAPSDTLSLPVSNSSAEYSLATVWHHQESTCQVHMHTLMYNMYMCIYFVCTVTSRSAPGFLCLFHNSYICVCEGEQGCGEKNLRDA